MESYREDGKVKQRVLEYVGKEENGFPVQKVDINKIGAENVRQYTELSVLHQLALELNLIFLLGKHHKSINIDNNPNNNGRNGRRVPNIRE